MMNRLHARARLRRMLNAAGAEVVAEGENGAQALSITHEYELDALIIDINMPQMNGMDAVLKIEAEQESPPAIVFCTAHDEYAVQAFKTEAVAYLLKPFSQKDLEQALKRATRRKVSPELEPEEHEQALEPSENELVLHFQGKLQKVNLNQIVYFYSHDKSVFAVMKNGDKVFVDFSLKYLEEHYGEDFIRAHRAYLVQTRELLGLQRGKNGASVSLRSSTVDIPVSRRHLKYVKACFVN